MVIAQAAAFSHPPVVTRCQVTHEAQQEDPNHPPSAIRAESTNRKLQAQDFAKGTAQ
jgi:hypothetical protein